MISALSVDRLKILVRQKYSGQETIIGIMLGRYDVQTIQQAINESYQYWNLNSGQIFDVYWAGYGEYIAEANNTTQIILKFRGNSSRVYYDLEKFIGFKDYIKNVKGLPYSDKFQILLYAYRLNTANHKT